MLRAKVIHLLARRVSGDYLIWSTGARNRPYVFVHFLSYKANQMTFERSPRRRQQQQQQAQCAHAISLLLALGHCWVSITSLNNG